MFERGLGATRIAGRRRADRYLHRTAGGGQSGDSQRFEYAVVGDTVNIASRLENFDRMHHPVDGFCRVLVGDATLRYLGGRFRVTELGQVRFKGKSKEIAVYRVDGDLSE